MLSIPGIIVGPSFLVGNVVDSVVMIEPEVDNVVTLTDLSLLPLLGVDSSERMFNFCYINIYVLVLAIVNNLIYLTLPLKLSWFSLVLFITNHSMYYNNLSHAFNNCNLLSAHLFLKNVHTVKKLFRFPILVKNKPFTSTKLSNCLSCLVHITKLTLVFWPSICYTGIIFRYWFNVNASWTRHQGGLFCQCSLQQCFNIIG